MTKKIDISEALPKSTRERILRKLRPKIKSPKKARKEPQMSGRVVPKKQGDNDPRRNNPRVGEALEFFTNNMHTSVESLSLDEYDKEGLLEATNHLIGVTMGGWSEAVIEDTEEAIYVNESGRIAKPENWTLNEDGTLSSKDGEAIEIDTDWLHALRKRLMDG
jgi:hypothetical protein